MKAESDNTEIFRNGMYKYAFVRYDTFVLNNFQFLQMERSR